MPASIINLESSPALGKKEGGGSKEKFMGFLKDM